MSHNPKYFIKSFKHNKVKSSDIREFWKNKKYYEENIVSINWQTLQLLILAVPVCQVNQKKTILSRWTDLLIVFFLYAV